MEHENSSLVIKRRLGPDPHEGGYQTPNLSGCPEIFELGSNDFAIIGKDVTDALRSKLPPGAGCGPDERIIEVPRRTLVLARPDIPQDL